MESDRDTCRLVSNNSDARLQHSEPATICRVHIGNSAIFAYIYAGANLTYIFLLENPIASLYCTNTDFYGSCTRWFGFLQVAALWQ